jgi:hypothetical protein
VVVATSVLLLVRGSTLIAVTAVKTRKRVVTMPKRLSSDDNQIAQRAPSQRTAARKGHVLESEDDEDDLLDDEDDVNDTDAGSDNATSTAATTSAQAQKPATVMPVDTTGAELAADEAFILGGGDVFAGSDVLGNIVFPPALTPSQRSKLAGGAKVRCCLSATRHCHNRDQVRSRPAVARVEGARKSARAHSVSYVAKGVCSCCCRVCSRDGA